MLLFCWENKSPTYSKKKFTQKDYWLNLVFFFIIIPSCCDSLEQFVVDIGPLKAVKKGSSLKLRTTLLSPPINLRLIWKIKTPENVFHKSSLKLLLFIFRTNTWKHILSNIPGWCDSIQNDLKLNKNLLKNR